MVDKLKNTSIHDIMLAKALGIDESELERMDLFKQKNEMQSLAFKYQEENTDITQECADILNNKYSEIIGILEYEYEVDLCDDYMINFNSFVPNNDYYHVFAY